MNSYVQNLAEIENIIKESKETAEDFDAVRKNVESLRAWRTFSIYQDLARENKQKVYLEYRAKLVYDSFSSEMSKIFIFINVHGTGQFQIAQTANLVKTTQNAGISVISVLRMQESSSALIAIMERKHAYAFGFVSLYAAIFSISLGLMGVFS